MYTQILRTLNENNREPNLLVCNCNPGIQEEENHQFNHPALRSESETSLVNEEHRTRVGMEGRRMQGGQKQEILTQDREKQR